MAAERPNVQQQLDMSCQRLQTFESGAQGILYKVDEIIGRVPPIRVIEQYRELMVMDLAARPSVNYSEKVSVDIKQMTYSKRRQNSSLQKYFLS
jgi:hypothetical protein